MRLFAPILFWLLFYKSACQEAPVQFIAKEKAVAIAKKHGLYPKLILREWPGHDNVTARLDTADKTWEIRSDKLTYRKWGKTTKQYESDKCSRCKHTNGCYVIRNRTIWINAVTGKVIKKEKTKKIARSYE